MKWTWRHADSDVPLLPHSNRAGDLAKFYFEVGGINVAVRETPVRICMWALAGSGALAALVAVMEFNHASNRPAAFKCALSAAVNFVAAGHYYAICRVRGQRFHESIADAVAVKMGAQREENNRHKVFVTEVMVDALRHNDWLLTLPIMYIELHRLATENLALGESIALSWWEGAWLQALIVVLGATHRFVLGEWTRKDYDVGEGWCRWLRLTFKSDSQLLLSTLVWALAAAIFAFTTEALLINDFDTSTEAKRSDVQQLHILLLVQIGYPLVSIGTHVVTDQNKWKDSNYGTGRWSFAKDVCYALLDAASKGGLALWSVFRTIDF